MRVFLSRALWAATVVFVIAKLGCGDDGPIEPVRTCWAEVPILVEEGQIEIGVGRDNFVPIGSSLNFEYGIQSGLQFVLTPRMRGLEPGTVEDFLGPATPLTKLSAVMADGFVVEPSCSLHYPYVCGSDGWCTMAAYGLLEFLPFELGASGYETNIKVVAEIKDKDGRYARAEHVVLAKPPIDLRDAGVDAMIDAP